MTTMQGHPKDWRSKVDLSIAKAQNLADEATKLEKVLEIKGRLRIAEVGGNLSSSLEHEFDGMVRLWLEKKLAERLDALQKIGV